MVILPSVRLFFVPEMPLIQVVAHPEAEDEDSEHIFLKRSEMLEQLKDIQGLPVFDEHEGLEDLLNGEGPDPTKQRGRVVRGWLDERNRLILEIDVPRVDVESVRLLNNVKKGKLKGASLGTEYLQDKRTGKILGKRIREVSLVEEGDLPGTTVVAVEPDSDEYTHMLEYLKADLQRTKLDQDLYKKRNERKRYLTDLFSAYANRFTELEKQPPTPQPAMSAAAPESILGKRTVDAAELDELKRQRELAAQDAIAKAKELEALKAEMERIKNEDVIKIGNLKKEDIINGMKMLEEKLKQEEDEKEAKRQKLQPEFMSLFAASAAERGVTNVEEDPLWKNYKDTILKEADPDTLQVIASAASARAVQAKRASELDLELQKIREEKRALESEMQVYRSLPKNILATAAVAALPTQGASSLAANAVPVFLGQGHAGDKIPTVQVNSALPGANPTVNIAEYYAKLHENEFTMPDGRVHIPPPKRTETLPEGVDSEFKRIASLASRKQIKPKEKEFKRLPTIKGQFGSSRMGMLNMGNEEIRFALLEKNFGRI